jgi:hypothetical protein
VKSIRPQLCETCSHGERYRAELLLAGGASIRSVSSKLSIPYHSLRRHWLNHVSPERKRALIMGPVVVTNLAEKIADENMSVLDHLRSVRAGLYALYDAAVSASDRTGGALLAGKLHENLGVVARLTGQLAQSPLVNIQNNFFISPEFAAVQSALLHVLSAHPSARDAVVREFRQLEARANAKVIDAAPAA